MLNHTEVLFYLRFEFEINLEFTIHKNTLWLLVAVKHMHSLCPPSTMVRFFWRTYNPSQTKHQPCISYVRGCIQKFPDWVYNEIHAYNNKHSLRSSTEGYGGKIHLTDSQNSDTTAPSGRELYHLQFSLQAASQETFGYTLIYAVEKASLNKQRNMWMNTVCRLGVHCIRSV
jgi:hypothetical protein